MNSQSQPFDYPTANLSTSWINSVSTHHSVSFTDGDNSIVRAILLRGTFGPKYACGFYCNGNCETYLLAIFIVQTNSGGGTLAWSTNTAGMSVVGLNLTELGNLLILFDAQNAVVWQSFDHPTDALVPGQILVSARNLTASVSTTNWTDEGGLYTLSMTTQGLVASFHSQDPIPFPFPFPPQVYYELLYRGAKLNNEASYAKFQNGSLQLYINSTEPNNPDRSISIPPPNSAQYMKLGSDGHLRVFEWGTQWNEIDDILTGYLGECNYPMVCGRFGICSNDQCSCPRTRSNRESFRQINDRQPNLGCSEVIPLTQRLASEIVLAKLLIFRYGPNSSDGDCYLPSQLFSLMNNEMDRTHYNSSVSIKVQIAPTIALSPEAEISPDVGNNSLLGPILGSAAGIFCVAVFIGIMVFVYRRKKNAEEIEEDYLDHVPGMPTRFSYEELVVATNNFDKKLGEGGFGSVYEGLLKDSTKIAVKCVDGIGHMKKSFLAEVESIGSIHHVNLVRLIGFCAEKSHRLLVYEYMCNGSLDRWIYSSRQETSLDWSSRKKIVLDIAKGLAYLHEDCRQKIIHLDIKPQNILLDENYNAKIADFGLSKLIDRNQSQVVTTMRGTPGYLAPEWLSAVITEKVDVYSFGVVVVEIVCGRKNFEQSEPEEERHLLSLFKKKDEEGQWVDLIDKCCEDMQSNGAEVVEMMKIAACCLQSDYANRPSMSMVSKVSEGVKDLEIDIDYNLLNPQSLITKIPQAGYQDTNPLLPSVLSGPR
ncbi:hypothetical protein BUALT_Bualt18G0032600 [Buddleja alternifolia]|uniref:Receptor-like serine/threonine-protein kinase n=1 Tax=Buddleja alternifolia TaxID=168488 RepID=A0AAV6WCH8_9LAMI|nr:hypothetical protein BUALT_Bualt18G0032600 [Buddleja alternifolia]